MIWVYLLTYFKKRSNLSTWQYQNFKGIIAFSLTKAKPYADTSEQINLYKRRVDTE